MRAFTGMKSGPEERRQGSCRLLGALLDRSNELAVISAWMSRRVADG